MVGDDKADGKQHPTRQKTQTKISANDARVGGVNLRRIIKQCLPAPLARGTVVVQGIVMLLSWLYGVPATIDAFTVALPHVKFVDREESAVSHKRATIWPPACRLARSPVCPLAPPLIYRLSTTDRSTSADGKSFR